MRFAFLNTCICTYTISRYKYYFFKLSRDTPSLVVEKDSSQTRVELESDSSSTQVWLEFNSSLTQVTRVKLESNSSLSRDFNLCFYLTSSPSATTEHTVRTHIYICLLPCTMYLLTRLRTKITHRRLVNHSPFGIVLLLQQPQTQVCVYPIPSMREGAGKYFKAPDPTIESFLAQPCSALKVV